MPQTRSSTAKAAAAAVHQQAPASPGEPKWALEPGTAAPDFTLAASPEQSTTLSDLLGQPIVLAFYPADWSPVCGDELSLFQVVLDEFEAFNAQILGISVDGAWCHAAYRHSKNLEFPLLADFEPKGEVARRYGVYRSGEGVTERALFVIDGHGVISWSHVSPIDVNPGVDGVLQALEAL